MTGQAAPAGATPLELSPRPRLRGWFHLAAVPVAIAGAWLVTATAARSGPSEWLATAVFGVFLVGLYATSSLYHVPPWREPVRAVWRRVDGAMIQLFIAATFTPIGYHTLSGGWRLWSLVASWAVAVVGAVIAASTLRAPRWVGTAGYIAAGWLLVVPLTRVMLALPWQGTGLIVLGGVLYTTGAVVFAQRWPDPSPRWFGYHEIFHLFVLAGSTAHYLAIWRYVLPSS